MVERVVVDPLIARLREIDLDIRAGRIGEAAALLNALRSTNPADVHISLFEGLLARATKNSTQEIIALQRTAAQAPRWPRAHMELAFSLSREGRHAEALAAADMAIDLAPAEMPPLETAIAVADAAGNPELARTHLRSALALQPDNLVLRRALGICLTNLGRPAEAEEYWRTLLTEHPGDPVSTRYHGLTLLLLGRKDEARTLFEQALQKDPGNTLLQFDVAVARGETPPTQPQEMVRGIFDGYASYFDRHLVGTLKYGVPKRVADIIRKRQHGNAEMNVLDLGCGTGLVGVYLGRVAGAFIGVDVSPKMLQQAARHKIYTALRHNDLLKDLRQSAAESFDYVVAADVFIYVGDVTEVIPACHRVLRRGGALIFSCETAEESEAALLLRPSKRYAHSRSSIERLCRTAGFANCALEPIDVRFENNAPIPGFIAVAEKR